MDAENIGEDTINLRVAEARYPRCMVDNSGVVSITRNGEWVVYDPLHNANQREEILDKYWGEITNKLQEWFMRQISTCDGLHTLHWYERDVFKANRNLWLLRAFVAVMEEKKH